MLRQHGRITRAYLREKYQFKQPTKSTPCQALKQIWSSEKQMPKNPVKKQPVISKTYSDNRYGLKIKTVSICCQNFGTIKSRGVFRTLRRYSWNTLEVFLEHPEGVSETPVTMVSQYWGQRLLVNGWQHMILRSEVTEVFLEHPKIGAKSSRCTSR